MEVLEDYGLNITEAELSGALKNEEEDKKSNKEKTDNAETISDYQLIRALDLVRALGLYGQGQGLIELNEKSDK